MFRDPIDYCDVLFRVLFTIILICGITFTIYGGLNTNMQSTQNGPNEQIFIVGVCILALYAILILLSLVVIIYEKCIETPSNLDPVIVVRIKNPKPPSGPIPKQAYRSYKQHYNV